MTPQQLGTAEQFAELLNCVNAIEDVANSSKLPATSTGQRSIGKAIIDMEIYVNTLINTPRVKMSGLRTTMNSERGLIMDEKIKTGLNMHKTNNHSADSWWKSVLESKAIHEIGPVVDAKQYRQCNKKLRDALRQVRPNARQAQESVEKSSEEELIRLHTRMETPTYPTYSEHPMLICGLS